MSKEKRKKAIYDYFINEAKKENSKKQKISINKLLDKEGKENRILFIMPRSIGDLVMCTSLFPSLKKNYPNCNLYVACENKYFSVLEGNSHIHKLLPYSEEMDNQPALEGMGPHKGYFLASFHPYFRTQKNLDYLHNGLGKSEYQLTEDPDNENNFNSSHLLSTYALSCGVKIGKPEIFDTYFPLEFKDYIILHASSGMESKNYDYFNDVVGEILPYLNKQGIKIVQIGDEKDKPISGCINFLGKTNIKQTFNLIKNAKLIFGNDSFSAHVAGIYNKKLVTIYSILYSSCCRPFFGDKNNQVIIDADRKGNAPTFSAKENPKTINNIMPEKISKTVLDSLNIENSLNNLKTHFIGESYSFSLVEIVPNFYNDKAFKRGSVNFRIDYCKNYDQKSIIDWAKDRMLQVFTDKPLDKIIINYCKNSIDEIVYKITEENKNYILDNIKDIMSIGKKVFIESQLSEEETKNLRMENFDLKIEKDKEKEKELDVDFKNGNVLYRSNKIILSENKLFPSKAAFEYGMIGSESAENKIVDDKKFIELLKQESEFIKIYEYTK